MDIKLLNTGIKEVREYNLADNANKGKDSVPKSVSSYIMEKSENTDYLTGYARKIQLNGYLKEVYENTVTEAIDPVSESTSVTYKDSEFSIVEYRAKNKIFTAAKITEEAAKDLSEQNFVEYILSRQQRTILKSLDKVLLLGNKTKGLEGVLSYDTNKGAHEVVSSVITNGEVIYTDLLDAFLSLDIEHRENAVCIMSSAIFKKVANLVDGDGEPFTDSIKCFGKDKHVLGCPIVINDNMPAIGTAAAGQALVVFANLEKAITIGYGTGRISKFAQAKSANLAENGLLGISTSLAFDTKLNYHDAISVLKNQGGSVTLEEPEIDEQIANEAPDVEVEYAPEPEVAKAKK